MKSLVKQCFCTTLMFAYVALGQAALAKDLSDNIVQTQSTKTSSSPNQENFCFEPTTWTSIIAQNSKPQNYPTQSSSIYLGTVGGADIYRDSGTGFITVVIAGIVAIFQGIGEALAYIYNSTTNNQPQQKRCEFQGEYLSNPNSTDKICAYKCRGYGALATFPWPKNQPCPPSFDGNFPGP